MAPRVKGLFIGLDGCIHAEHLPTNKREIEYIDGAHPFIPAAIYHDIDHRGPPLYIVWHGRQLPEGIAADGRLIEESLIKEAVHMSQHGLKPLMSRRWTRCLIYSSLIFFKAIIIGFIIALVALLIWIVVQ